MRHATRLVMVGLLFWTGLVGAQGAAPAAKAPAAPPPARPPVIWIDPGHGALQPIALDAVAVDVSVHGFVASTTVALTFRNPNARVLEGELVFPLASGQSVTGYALDVAGTLREGVVVPKETARVAFEAITRRGVDPGLAELTAGNVFRTRIYPLPAGGTRRVAIRFDQPLIDTGAAYRYVLPLQYGQMIGRFSVRAEAVRTESAPSASGALVFDRVADAWVASLERENVTPQRELAFDVPKPTTPVATYAVADALEPAWRTFATQVADPRPAKLAPLPLARRVAIYYDASGSARERDRERELALIEAWLAKLGEVEVTLLPFRDALDAPQVFAIRRGDASALRRAIGALALDGGSSYGAIRAADGANADVVLVVGDGLSNFGGHDPVLAPRRGGDGSDAARAATSPRVVVLHAAQAFDAARLEKLAARHGGRVLNLLEMSVPDALARIDEPRFVLQSARVVAGECRDLAPAAPRAVQGAFAIYGRCRGDATVELAFGTGDGATVTRRIRVDAADLLDPVRAAFVPRLWAVARIADLAEIEGPDAPEATRLALAHGVVTRNTSMLVLEAVADYVRYGVVPREPELRAQYDAAVAAQPKLAVSADVAARIAAVESRWNAFREWHDTRHPWLETVLLPTAQRERAAWRQIAPSDARGEAAEKLVRRADALAARWADEGADDAHRTAWEREATDVMLALDRLQRDRAEAKFERGPADATRDADTEVDAAVVLAEPASAPSAREERPRTSAAPATAPERHVDAGADDGAQGRAKSVGGAEAKRDAADDAASEVAQRTAIELTAWNPDTPYLAQLRDAADPYAAYLRERESNAKSPAFFLDCADYFRTEAKNSALSLRVLSNLAEIDFESVPLIRVLAYRLQQWQRDALAVPLFEDALRLRGEEPQSRRDLALALARSAAPDTARAVDLLFDVVAGQWDGRFADIELIALHELLDVLAGTPADERAAIEQSLRARGATAALLRPLPVGLRVALTWDVDNTDVDLWITDPTGERTMYSAPRSKTGGHLSRDFTGGYGPEVYTIRRPLPGTYVVQAHYFGDRRQTLGGPATLQAEFITGFGTAASRRTATTRRVDKDGGEIEIGRFTVE